MSLGITQSIPSSAISSLTISFVLKKKLIQVSPPCFGRQGEIRLLQTNSFSLFAFLVSPVVPARSSAKASSSWNASCVPGCASPLLGAQSSHFPAHGGCVTADALFSRLKPPVFHSRACLWYRPWAGDAGTGVSLLL